MASIQNRIKQDLHNSNISEPSKEEESNKKSSDYEGDMNGNSKNKLDDEFMNEQNNMREKNTINFSQIKNQKIKIYPLQKIKHFINLFLAF